MLFDRLRREHGLLERLGDRLDAWRDRLADWAFGPICPICREELEHQTAPYCVKCYDAVYQLTLPVVIAKRIGAPARRRRKS